MKTNQTPKIYRCQRCRSFYEPAQLKVESTPSGASLYLCPTDNTMVVDATHTPAGESFITGQPVKTAILWR